MTKVDNCAISSTADVACPNCRRLMKQLLQFLSCFGMLFLAGCEPATPGNVIQAANAKAPELDATSEIATFTTPSGCLKNSAEKDVQPYSVGFQSGYIQGSSTSCKLPITGGEVIVSRAEYTVPFRLAFNLGTAADRDVFRSIIPMDPRRYAVPWLKQAERQSLGGAPGANFTNHKYSVLANDGGVYGADACLTFSFDAEIPNVKTRHGSNWKSRGLRCSRVRRDTLDVEYVLLDISVNYPEESGIPSEYAKIANQTEASLRYR